jgi:hypothetical protein
MIFRNSSLIRNIPISICSSQCVLESIGKLSGARFHMSYVRVVPESNNKEEADSWQ